MTHREFYKRTNVAMTVSKFEQLRNRYKGLTDDEFVAKWCGENKELVRVNAIRAKAVAKRHKIWTKIESIRAMIYKYANSESLITDVLTASQIEFLESANIETFRGPMDIARPLKAFEVIRNIEKEDFL